MVHDAGITHGQYQSLCNVVPELPRMDHIKALKGVVQKDALAEDTNLKPSFTFTDEFLSKRSKGFQESNFDIFIKKARYSP